MLYNPENIYYLRETLNLKSKASSLIYLLFERFLVNNLTCEFDVQGKENIKNQGPLEIVLAPHTGLMECPSANLPFEQQRIFPIWTTKEETLKRNPILTYLLQTRHFPITRHEVDRQALKYATQIIENEGVIATALEGTRGKEFEDRSSVSLQERMELGEAFPGALYIAHKTRVPIQPVAVWGTEDDRLFPFADVIIDQEGTVQFAKYLIQQMRQPRSNKPPIHVRILPEYRDHLANPYYYQKKLSSGLQTHSHKIMLQIAQVLPENWPRGFYENKYIDESTGALVSL